MKKPSVFCASLLAVLLVSLNACSGKPQSSRTVIQAGDTPVPVHFQADPYAWFDKPLDGFRLSRAPYTVVLHASAYQGIAAVELRITGEPVLTVDNPAPGKILVTIQHTWTPPRVGRYVLQARTRDSNDQWSQTAVVTVDVIELTTSTSTPTQPTATPTPTQTATPSTTPTPQGDFTQPVFSPDVIVENSSCQPRQLTATIGATDPQGVKVVVAFYCLVDRASGDASDWDNAAMRPIGQDKYQIVFQPAPVGGALHPFAVKYIEKEGSSFSAFVRMQFAIQTLAGTIVRSPVYTAATLKNCLP